MLLTDKQWLNGLSFERLEDGAGDKDFHYSRMLKMQTLAASGRGMLAETSGDVLFPHPSAVSINWKTAPGSERQNRKLRGGERRVSGGDSAHLFRGIDSVLYFHFFLHKLFINKDRFFTTLPQCILKQCVITWLLIMFIKWVAFHCWQSKSSFPLFL